MLEKNKIWESNIVVIFEAFSVYIVHIFESKFFDVILFIIYFLSDFFWGGGRILTIVWFLTIILIFDRNFYFWPQFGFLTETFDLWPKIWIFDHSLIFDQNFDFWPNFYFWPNFLFLTKFFIFDQNFDFLPTFWFLTKI